MSSRINTILIIGATSGIGEAFARRFHNLGKTVIITGRNQEKLETLAQELPGLKVRQVRWIVIFEWRLLGLDLSGANGPLFSVNASIVAY